MLCTLPDRDETLSRFFYHTLLQRGTLGVHPGVQRLPLHTAQDYRNHIVQCAPCRQDLAKHFKEFEKAAKAAGQQPKTVRTTPRRT